MLAYKHLTLTLGTEQNTDGTLDKKKMTMIF